MNLTPEQLAQWCIYQSTSELLYQELGPEASEALDFLLDQGYKIIGLNAIELKKAFPQ